MGQRVGFVRAAVSHIEQKMALNPNAVQKGKAALFRADCKLVQAFELIGGAESAAAYKQTKEFLTIAGRELLQFDSKVVLELAKQEAQLAMRSPKEYAQNQFKDAVLAPIEKFTKDPLTGIAKQAQKKFGLPLEKNAEGFIVPGKVNAKFCEEQFRRKLKKFGIVTGNPVLVAMSLAKSDTTALGLVGSMMMCYAQYQIIEQGKKALVGESSIPTNTIDAMGALFSWMKDEIALRNYEANRAADKELPSLTERMDKCAEALINSEGGINELRQSMADLSEEFAKEMKNVGKSDDPAIVEITKGVDIILKMVAMHKEYAPQEEQNETKAQSVKESEIPASPENKTPQSPQPTNTKAKQRMSEQVSKVFESVGKVPKEIQTGATILEQSNERIAESMVAGLHRNFGIHAPVLHAVLTLDNYVDMVKEQSAGQHTELFGPFAGNKAQSLSESSREKSPVEPGLKTDKEPTDDEDRKSKREKFQ